MLDHLERLVKTAKELHAQWKCWAPPTEQKDFQCRIWGLEQVFLTLTSRKVDLYSSKSHRRCRKSGDCSLSSISYSTPAIKLKPTFLPKFTGIRCDFHWSEEIGKPFRDKGSQLGQKKSKSSSYLTAWMTKLQAIFAWCPIIQQMISFAFWRTVLEAKLPSPLRAPEASSS